MFCYYRFVDHSQNINRLIRPIWVFLNPMASERLVAVEVVRVLTSLLTKVRVFSEVSRRRKTEVSYFTSQFLNNY
jgi:hypothetical protein